MFWWNLNLRRSTTRPASPPGTRTPTPGSTAKYDERGNQTEWAYFDEAGQPTRHKDGYTKADRGSTTSGAPRSPGEMQWGHDGSNGFTPATSPATTSGATSPRWPSSTSKGRPARHKDGYVRWTAKYDERGNQNGIGLFRRARPAARHKDGYARLGKKYDERGNLIEIVSLDEAGRPVRDNTGYIGVTRRYDERGKLVEENRWGFDPAAGYARNNIRYDERGNPVELTYFDEAGQPTRHKDGYTRLTKEYDERGRLARQMQWGHDGSNGFTRNLARYDERGNITEMAFFDEQGRPARHKDGYAKVDGQVRRAGQPDGIGLLRRGRPAHPAQGRLRQVHRQVRRRGGNQTELAYFDEAGQPTRHKDGYARLTKEYDERGRARPADAMGPRW